MKSIPYGRQHVEPEDIQEVIKVLDSDWLSQGPKGKEFEQSLAEYCGAKFAITFSSGTAALHAAYFAAGLGAGDEIVTSPMTFLATSNAALYLGANVAFVDTEKNAGNIDSGLIERAITDKTRLIVPVHFAGHPAELEQISATARRNKLLLIEDACHALGAKYKNTTIGDCTYSDMAVLSFHPVKSITTGEGGAVLTNNEDWYKKLTAFRQHGVVKEQDAFYNKEGHLGQWYYKMQYLGFNYKLTDIQSALGISQLRKLDSFIRRRRDIVEIYAAAFKDNPFFELPVEKKHVSSSWHLYPIRLKDKYKQNKIKLFAELREGGLGVQVHYIPVHLQPYYQQLGYRKGLCPNAEDFYEREISIPLYPAMSDEDVDYVIKKIFEVFRKN